VPDVIQAALDIERFGADGITVHPRPDERHIRYADVYALKPLLKTEFNIEGNPTPKFIKLIEDIRPAQCTLVPDADHAFTSDAGWDTLLHKDFLRDVITHLKSIGVRVSLFINAEPGMAEGAAAVGAHRVELYTGPYAAQYKQNKEASVKPYVATAQAALQAGLGINAGHDLDMDNLAYLKLSLPQLDEVSIGHALICDALYYGLQNIIPMYKRRLQ
jgi:pyridoxine 5-phosphate synthase